GAALVGHDHAGLTRNELGAQVIGMAAQARYRLGRVVQNGTQVGKKAVVAGHQLIELAARADVFVVEDLRRLAARRPQELEVETFLQPGRGRLGAGKNLLMAAKPPARVEARLGRGTKGVTA